MNTKSFISIVAGLVILGGAITATARTFALPDRENDALADLRAAKISLGDAVALGVAQFGGQAVRAELDSEHGAVAYEIELVIGASVREVRLDAVTGAVLASRDDVDDEGGDDDDDDE